MFKVRLISSVDPLLYLGNVWKCMEIRDAALCASFFDTCTLQTTGMILPSTVQHGLFLPTIYHFFIGKPSINGPFPMAMLNNQRVMLFQIPGCRIRSTECGRRLNPKLGSFGG